MEIHTTLEDSLKAFCFMQDGVYPHRTSSVFNFLSEHFSERSIVLDYDMHTGSDMAWSPYLPDLISCDFFLWGYLKDLVHCQTPQTIAELKQHICTASETIPSNMFEQMSGHFCLKLIHIIATNRCYF